MLDLYEQDKCLGELFTRGRDVISRLLMTADRNPSGWTCQGLDEAYGGMLRVTVPAMSDELGGNS